MPVRERLKRKHAIIAVADDMRTDSMDGQGLNPSNYERDNLVEVVENCTGYKLMEHEIRLAVVAFEQGTATAKESIWYEI